MPTKIFTGSNSVEEFIKRGFEQEKYCDQTINKKLKMTIEDEDNYQNSNDCCICEKIINNKDKVR